MCLGVKFNFGTEAHFYLYLKNIQQLLIIIKTFIFALHIFVVFVIAEAGKVGDFL